MGKSSGTGGIAKLMGKAFKEGAPIRAGIKSNLLDILGGGSGAANLPMVQSAVAASKDATAQSLRQDANSATAWRTAGTPFAENVSSQARIAGNQATAGIPSQIAQHFLAAFGAPAAYGTQATSASLAGASAQENAGKLGALGGLGQGLGSMFGKGGAGTNWLSSLGKGSGTDTGIQAALLAV